MEKTNSVELVREIISAMRLARKMQTIRSYAYVGIELIEREGKKSVWSVNFAEKKEDLGPRSIVLKEPSGMGWPWLREETHETAIDIAKRFSKKVLEIDAKQ